MYTIPDDGGQDLAVWSLKKLITPLSYMNPKVLKDNLVGQAPPPTYFKYSTMIDNTIATKMAMLDGLQIQTKGGLKCVNEKILDKQKGVIKEVLSQAASNVFSGQSIIGISLPVRIFEPRSLLERICDWYGNAPVYLKQAAGLKDPLERFKLTIAFALSSLYCAIK